jgi:hypothetical protein
MSTHPFNEPITVFVFTESGALPLAPDGDRCRTCRDTGYIPIWHPEITDGLTHDLMPADRRVLTPPCPECRAEQWRSWPGWSR